MGKKRKTKQQKIITKLKRELQLQQRISIKKTKAKKTENKLLSKKPLDKKPVSLKKSNPRSEKLLFAYDPKLIKKDLIKTLILSFIFIGIIFMLKFFPLLELIFRR